MSHFDYTLEGPIGTRATLGLVVLQTDETIEHDFRQTFTQDGVALYVSRVPNATDVNHETLSAMSDALPTATGLFPEALSFDVVGYGCTSGSAVIGPDQITQQVKAGCSTAHVTNPLSALVAICAHHKVSRLGLLSPYVESVSQTLRDALASEGIKTPVFGSFDEGDDSKVARISKASLYDAAMQVGATQDSEAVFLSCTNLRTLAVIPEIERDLGKPVFSSNQALAWHMGHLAGL